jgi:uncharacterized protein YdcH (DUF465 family)
LGCASSSRRTDSYFPDPTFDRVFDALNALDTRMKETRADWEKEMEAEAL